MPNRRSQRPQGHRQPTGVQLKSPPAQPDPPPKPPTKINKVAQEAWDAYWSSPISRASDAPDEYALRRWIEAVNEREKLHKVVQKNPTVRGSQGQPVINPLARRLEQLESHIEHFEWQFGMTPKARAQLGIAAGQAQMTADQLNRMANEDAPNQDGEDEETIGGDAEEIEGFEEA